MAYKPKTKKSFKKKVYKKKAYVKKSSPVKNLSMVTLGQGFPKKIMMTHKYHSYIQVASVAGSTWVQNFSANGMYDPDITGTGHQPMYYDQASAVWAHWTVVGSKITVKFTNAIAANSMSACHLYLNDDATVTPANVALGEQSSSKNVIIPFGSTDNHVKSLSYSAKKTFGGAILSNNSLLGTATSDPTESVVFSICGLCPNVGSATVNLDISIEYIAIWTELRDLAAS